MSGIEFYFAGKMLVIRIETYYGLVFDNEENLNPCLLVGDIRRGLLINTERGETKQILYTHKGMLDKGYLFGCTGELADAKLAAITAKSVPIKEMYGNTLPHEACEASSHA